MQATGGLTVTMGSRDTEAMLRNLEGMEGEITM